MEHESKTGERPIVVWEGRGEHTAAEAAVRTIPIGQPGETGGPVIRIFSTGFGQGAPSPAGGDVRMAA